MSTYYLIFISRLKKWQKDQDPVHITSNQINVLFKKPATPLVLVRWVCWASTFCSWWDKKVWSTIVMFFPLLNIPKTTQTANCIVWFGIKGCCWFWGPFSKFSLSSKMIEFLTEKRKSSGYQLWVCQVGVTIIREVLSLPLLFSVLCELRQLEVMHIDSCDTIFVEEPLCQVCWDQTSKRNNLKAYLTALKETGLFLVSFPIFGIVCWKLEGIVFASKNHSGAEIPNLHCNWDIPYFLWDLH